MKRFIKTAAKVLYDYIVVLILYLIVIYTFIAITKDRFIELIPYYGLVFLVFVFLLIYLDMNKIAVKERKPQYGYKAYPFKGFVYGLVGVIPLAVIVVIASLIQFQNTFLNNLRHIGINVLLGPMYIIIRWLKEEPVGYASALMVLPVISMLGYLSGYLGIGKKQKIKNDTAEEKFVKSPWNPSNSDDTKKDNTKKK
jgi:hypothetical protein